MKKALVSIIIPIYKVEPYLRRCLDSVLNQTYSNLEIILVDDGSPDKCPQLCDEYAAKDNRIIVIHKKNGGLSDARNAGLDKSNGEYISFVDSDDWIDEKYVDKLLNIALKENADISIGENIKIHGNFHITPSETTIKSYSSKEALIHLFTHNHIAFNISCGKLYKKHLFSSLRFPVGKFHEDEFTTYLLFYNAKKISYTSAILYYYYQRTDSIVSIRHPWDVLEFLEQRYIFFKEKKETELLPLILPPLCWQLLCAYWFVKENKLTTSCDYLKKLRLYKKDIQTIHVSIYHKFFISLFARFPLLYILYRKQPFKWRKEF